MQILRAHKLNIHKKYIFLVALLFSLIVVFQVSNTSEGGDVHIVLGHIVLFVSNYMVWALMIAYINGAIKPLDLRSGDRARIFFQAFVSLTMLAFIHVIITNMIYYSFLYVTTDINLEGVYNSIKPYLIKAILSRYLDLAIISFLIKMIATYRTIQKQKMQVVSLENQLHKSQLEALRSQLNPHFLFNSLHTLNTLIGYDDAKARSMVIKITGLLRKMLSLMGKHSIPFEEELAYFKNYLEIEQERFNDRLAVKLEIDEATLQVRVPTLMLQPLIENAFKHGISHVEGNGHIKLVAKIERDELHLVLSNTIPGHDISASVSSTKVGLHNLRSRLDQMFGNSYQFSTRQSDGLFEVILRMKVINEL